MVLEEVESSMVLEEMTVQLENNPFYVSIHEKIQKRVA